MNSLNAAYNPVTDNCQEFVEELLKAATGSYRPLSTVGDQVKSTVVKVLRYGATASVFIILLVGIVIVGSSTVVYFGALDDRPAGDIWLDEILDLSYFFANHILNVIVAFPHFGLRVIFSYVFLYFYLAVSVLCATYATAILLVKCYSCDGADLIEQWSGVTVWIFYGSVLIPSILVL